MRKLLVFIIVLLLVPLATFTVGADTTEDTGVIAYPESLSEDTLSELESAIDLQGMYESLPQESRESLERMGLVGGTAESLRDVTFGSVMNEVLGVIASQSGSAFSSLALLIAVMLIYSIAESFSLSLQNDTLRDVLSVVTALCIACALVIPATDIISSAANVVSISSNLMLSYIPIMVTVLVSSGQTVTSSEYYSMMVAASSGIAKLYSEFVTPLLSVFLGVSVCTTVMPDMKFDGLVSFFSKSVRWVLSFSFTIFTALLSFKTLIATSLDSVSTRAVRYTVSSFVPVVGSALSEAYRTVASSVNILKSGIGVFMIFAIGSVFLPLIVRLLMWQFSVGISRCFAEIINLRVPNEMLGGVSSVLGTLLAILLCIMALFIISTALLITAGGFVR